MNNLINKELLIKIYQYDPTYHYHFKNFVLPYLKKKWYIRWECKKTLISGVSLSEFPGLKTEINNERLKKYSYNYFTCMKKCKVNDMKFEAFKHYPYFFNIL